MDKIKKYMSETNIIWYIGRDRFYFENQIGKITVHHDQGLWLYNDQKYMFSQLLTKLCGIEFLKAWEIEKQLMFEEISETLNDYKIIYTFANEVFKIDKTNTYVRLGCGNRWVISSPRRYSINHHDLVNDCSFFLNIKMQIVCQQKIQPLNAEKMIKSAQETVHPADFMTEPTEPVRALDFMTEPTETELIDICTVKSMTGGDVMTSRQLHSLTDKKVNEESETSKLSTSSVKFCGKQIGDDKIMLKAPKLPCYGTRIGEMEKNIPYGVTGATVTPGAIGPNGVPGAIGPNGVPGAIGPNGVPGAIGLNGVPGAIGPAPLIKQKTNVTPFVVNLQELLQVKGNLKSVAKPVNNINITERDAIETLSKSCHEVQMAAKLSKSVRLTKKSQSIVDNKIQTIEKEKSVEIDNEKIPTKQLYPNLSFRKLSNINGPNSDLRCIDMNMTIIENSDFSNSDMRCAQMMSMMIKNTNLSGTDLTGATLKQTVFKNVDFTGAKLCNLNCDEIKFKNCIFTDANIKHSSFVNAILQGTILANNDLTGCCFKGANLVDTGITTDVANLYPGVSFVKAYVGFKKIYL